MIPKEKLGLLDKINSRIESELEVKSYIQNLKYALDNGAKITFKAIRSNIVSVRRIFPYC